jgi:hypothetical protein
MLHRPEAIKLIGIGALATVCGVNCGASILEAGQSGGNATSYSLPNLPYAYDALEPYIDAQTMHLHHDKHHAAYVRYLTILTGCIHSPASTAGRQLNHLKMPQRTTVRKALFRQSRRHDV